MSRRAASHRFLARAKGHDRAIDRRQLSGEDQGPKPPRPIKATKRAAQAAADRQAQLKLEAAVRRARQDADRGT